jgi:hypothetical protein
MAAPMFGARAKTRVGSWHRWLGLGLSLPLVGWTVSAALMMLITMDAPNGLAGVYQLNPYNSVDVRLDAATVDPANILETLATEHGIRRVYWLRLQSRGPHLWYVAKPTPTALAMVFDARTGRRLDPLPDTLLEVVAAEALVGGRVAGLKSATEYNRYYELDRLPATWASLTGAQPATLILSRDEGRTLRRLNSDSERFNWWYRAFHVNQFSDHKALWTTLLYLAGVGVVALALLGYLLFWWRRPKRATADSETRSASLAPSRNWHRKLGAVAGGVLAIELVVGGYLWMSLGPLEDPFRGKASFNPEWAGGFGVESSLARPGEVLATVAAALPESSHPVQAIEWRQLGSQAAWLVTARLDQEPLVFASGTGAPIDSLAPEMAGEIARQEVIGKPSFKFIGRSTELWMDLNRQVPTYHLRFNDPGSTDVYVSEATGQIIQRRPWFWRIFGPFLAVHMFSFTGNKTVDMALLVSFQLSILGMIATGWRLHFPGKRVSRQLATADAQAAAPAEA